jgi:hypothetical protein
MVKWYALSVVATLVAALYYLIAFEHWGEVGPQQESVLGPLTLAVLATLLAERAFRRTRRPRPDR